MRNYCGSNYICFNQKYFLFLKEHISTFNKFYQLFMIKKYYELLSEFIAFKSISPDKHFSEELKKSADWLANLFQDH